MRRSGKAGCLGAVYMYFNTTKTHLIPYWHLMPDKKETLGMS